VQSEKFLCEFSCLIYVQKITYQRTAVICLYYTFITSKNLTVESMTFPCLNIHKLTWTSPGRKTHNQIDHILIDRRQYSSVLDVRLFRAADCDTDHYLKLKTKLRGLSPRANYRLPLVGELSANFCG
jgi:hypothetical protein